MTKLDSENFNDDWTLKYLFILHQLCLIRNRCVCRVTSVCRLWRNRIWCRISQQNMGILECRARNVRLL